MGGACLYMPQDGHWLASFEVTPPLQKLVFPRPKSPLKTVIIFPNPIFFLKILAAFSVFAAKILSRRSRLSRWSRAPSRLIRPRPIDWDRGPKQRVKNLQFPGFWVRTSQKKFFQKVQSLVLIYTPKEAHSRIFVTGGSVIAWQMLAKKKAVLGQASLYKLAAPRKAFHLVPFFSI